MSRARALEARLDTGATRRPQVAFGGIRVATSTVVDPPRVIQPRPWTLAQSVWAHQLSPTCRPGPVLELFAGSGHIGLEASRRTGRPAVLVDFSAEACQLAAETARINGLDASVIAAAVSQAVCERSRPGLVLADPPYVPTSEVCRFPGDPDDAIDGGPDGLSLVRTVLRASHPVVSRDVPLVLQLRGQDQAVAVDEWLGDRAELGVRIVEVRVFGGDRALALIRPRR